MSTRPARIALLAMLALFGLLTSSAATSRAASLVPEASFGDNGTARPHFGTFRTNAQFDDATVGVDGSTTVVEKGAGALIRFLPSGARDPGFGSGGMLTFGDLEAVWLAAQGDKMLVGLSDGTVRRIGPDGALDPGYGAAGVAGTQVPVARSATVAGDGSTFIVGTSEPTGCTRYGCNYQYRIEKLTASGQPDTGFGSGAVITPPGAPSSVAIQSGGALIVTTGYGLYRYSAAGVRDVGFGGGGTLAAGAASAVDSSGRIVTVGLGSGTGSLALRRYLPGGNADATFGTGGVTERNFGGYVGAGGIVIDPSGAIDVVASYNATSTSDYRFLFARFLPDGSPDPTFGTGGSTTVAQPHELAYSLIPAFGLTGSLALGPGDTLLLGTGTRGAVDAGTSGFTPSNALLVRLEGSGAPDSSFGTGGLVEEPAIVPSNDSLNAVAQDPRGRVLIAATTNDGDLLEENHLALMRLRPDGSLDPSFGARGVSDPGFGASSATKFLPLPDGSALLAGVFTEEPASLRRSIVRVRSDGSIARSFGKHGFAILDRAGSFVEALARDRRGRIVVGLNDGGAAGARVARLLPNGRLDHSFGQGGLVKIGFGGELGVTSVALDARGRILATGRSGKQLYAVRLGPNGKWDRGFARRGRFRASLGVKSAGEEIVPGEGRTIFIAGQFGRTLGNGVVLKLNRRGRLVRRFATGGRLLMASTFIRQLRTVGDRLITLSIPNSGDSVAINAFNKRGHRVGVSASVPVPSSAAVFSRGLALGKDSLLMPVTHTTYDSVRFSISDFRASPLSR